MTAKKYARWRLEEISPATALELIGRGVIDGLWWMGPNSEALYPLERYGDTVRLADAHKYRWFIREEYREEDERA